MPISPSSLTITAVSPIEGCSRRLESKVVLPLPRKPVRTATGARRSISARAPHEPGVQRIERASGQPLGRLPERAEVADDLRPALAVAQHVDAAAPVAELAARSGRAPDSVAPRGTREARRALARPPPSARRHAALRRARTRLRSSTRERPRSLDTANARKETSMAKEILCAYGIDVDAVAGWLGSYGGENSPDDISRGLFAGEVGTPRLLELFEHYGMKTTWFIPGHSIETFPKQTKMVVDAGHEIGIHGYSHENPIAMTREQEKAVLVKCIDLVKKVSGRRPTGYVAPWWEFSPRHERAPAQAWDQVRPLAHAQRLPPLLRPGRRQLDEDRLLEVREAWMKPLRRGKETDLIEIPASWYLDDLPPMMFIKASPNSHGFVNPRHRADLDRPVRLGLPRVRLRRLHHDRSTPTSAAGPGASDARADHRAHQQARTACAGRRSTRSPTTSQAQPAAGRSDKEAARRARQGSGLLVALGRNGRSPLSAVKRPQAAFTRLGRAGPYRVIETRPPSRT